MRKALRGILAVLAGFIAASVVMMVIETINGRVLYPELGKQAAGMTDREQIKVMMASAPLGAFLVVLIGWALGSFAGGFLTARIGSAAPMAHAVALGVMLTLAGIANNLMIPPPAWFWIPTLVVFLPAAYAGARFASGKSPAKT